MIDVSMFFKINSETDESKLIKLINTAVKRVNVLRDLQRIPKAEIIEAKPIENLEINNANNQTEGGTPS